MKKLTLILVLLFMSSIVFAQTTQDAVSLQDAFVRVSKEVGPAVVSISTEHVEKYSTRYYPFSQFHDDFFDNFFEDFFVTGPDREFKRIGLGSGVIIDREGHILTNEHVVRDADKITVTLPDGREFEGQLSGSDIYSDLAVIKIEPGGDLPVARLGDSDDVEIGHWAIAIGNPFAFAVKNPEPTLTVGVVSALRRTLPRTDKRAREYSDLIQTDAAINPGNSGGPLVNIHGEVIGINVAILGNAEGIGFAVPVNTARKIMGDLIEGRKILYGWLGVVIQGIDVKLAEYFGLENKQGVLISRILDKSPAEKAGLKPGDIIISFDNENVKTTQDLIRMVLKKDIGEKAALGVIRDKKIYSANVEIGARPEEQAMAAEKEKKAKDEVALKFWRGLEVSDVTPEISQRFKLEIDSGVIVIDVEAGSPAEASGIRTGDVIYEINRIPVRSRTDYKNAIKGVTGDALIGTYRGYVVIKER
ncbi:MAG: Do family serine endopeptidase [Candidatus Omnitrophica bacterium]|nr:Do family serine endopeptidase [Candidatus Omnitrophota bacterium]MBU4589750.1 Do family serine endopeptidase [Candidatus Omnitrophota bacterium]